MVLNSGLLRPVVIPGHHIPTICYVPLASYSDPLASPADVPNLPSSVSGRRTKCCAVCVSILWLSLGIKPNDMYFLNIDVIFVKRTKTTFKFGYRAGEADKLGEKNDNHKQQQWQISWFPKLTHIHSSFPAVFFFFFFKAIQSLYQSRFMNCLCCQQAASDQSFFFFFSF